MTSFVNMCNKTIDILWQWDGSFGNIHSCGLCRERVRSSDF